MATWEEQQALYKRFISVVTDYCKERYLPRREELLQEIVEINEQASNWDNEVSLIKTLIARDVKSIMDKKGEGWLICLKAII